ncbi:protoporphyrinogen oxidase [Bacillus taeanensis]|uniref:Coproporphyrinogen III oxidase n=1 Tax=Bacillus taeanensis TaxID=273032 RepID=A0A366XZ00_9BACI|nr:protoporphyrinogen oxidase [Bacillus taeanensis]RBW69394.1 protoporphyrinogen oxidase [Bacillus taeanensis]
MKEGRRHIAIIGGGMTGLAAAYYLQKEIKEKKLPITYTLIESSNRLGGKIQTDYTNGFIIEQGPDSFLARKKSAGKLAADVGLSDELVSNSTGQAYVLSNAKLHPIPGGAVMGIPTELGPFMSTSLFSPAGKARAALDLVLPRKSGSNEDQSLGRFFRRRLGDEVVENLIEPLLSGIYAGDIDRLSLMSTFPQFYEVEQKHRSLIFGMKKTRPKSKKEPNKKPSMFLTLKNGLESLVHKVEEQLNPHSIYKNTSVKKVTKEDRGYMLTFVNGETLYADAVIMTTPHNVTAKMFNNYSFMNSFHDTPSTTVATVAMAFDESALKQELNGTGFVISRQEDFTITACTWTNKKWPHTTPDGKVLLRCYVGRAGNSRIVEEKDEVIVKTVLDDLNKIMKIEGRPEFYRITRLRESMPQYTVGHKYRLEAMKSRLKSELSGVFLAGMSYGGVGIPDCIDQGINAVHDVLEYSKVE